MLRYYTLSFSNPPLKGGVIQTNGRTPTETKNWNKSRTAKALNATQNWRRKHWHLAQRVCLRRTSSEPKGRPSNPPRFISLHFFVRPKRPPLSSRKSHFLDLPATIQPVSCKSRANRMRRGRRIVISARLPPKIRSNRAVPRARQNRQNRPDRMVSRIDSIIKGQTS